MHQIGSFFYQLLHKFIILQRKCKQNIYVLFFIGEDAEEPEAHDEPGLDAYLP